MAPSYAQRRRTATECLPFANKAMHDAHVGMGFREGTGIALDQFEAHVAAMKAGAG